MRAAPERNPLRASLRRADAADVKSLNAHLRASGEVAVMLAQDSRAALDEAIPKGRAAMEAAFSQMKQRAVLANFFASRALLYLECPLKACKRARRCASLSLHCTHGFVLAKEEEARARAKFREFVEFMRAPEEESVMPGHSPFEDGRKRPYDPGIHNFSTCKTAAWIAGSGPAMTKRASR